MRSVVRSARHITAEWPVAVDVAAYTTLVNEKGVISSGGPKVT